MKKGHLLSRAKVVEHEETLFVEHRNERLKHGL